MMKKKKKKKKSLATWLWVLKRRELGMDVGGGRYGLCRFLGGGVVCLHGKHVHVHFRISRFNSYLSICASIHPTVECSILFVSLLLMSFVLILSVIPSLPSSAIR